MRPESNFWSKLKRKVDKGIVLGKWQRVEVKLPEGFPDCLVNLSGRIIFVELKAVDEEQELKTELRPMQANWIDNWNDAGGDAYILAHIKSLKRMQWYQHGRLMRQGSFMQVPCPRGIYASGYAGEV